MSELKKLTQAINAIALFFHEPADAENSNRFDRLQDRVLFNICDTLAGNVQWVLNTGLPNAQRAQAMAERSNKGGEIDLATLAEREAYLKTLTDQLMLADAALDEAMKVYTKYTGSDYVWVPYAERKRGAVKSTTADAAEAVAAKLRAKHGVAA